MRRCTLPVIASMLALGLALAPARAPAQSAADKETARSLMDDGDKKFAAKDYAGALKAFQGADAIMGVPTTLFEVAKAQEALGLLAEARDTYLQVVRLPQRPRESAAFAGARKDADARATALAARIPSLKVTVTGPPPDAVVTVTLDGVAVPPAAIGLPRKANPGKHTVVASAAGFSDQKRELILSDAESADVTLELKPAGAAAPPPVAPAPVAPAPAPAVKTEPAPPAKPEPRPPHADGGGIPPLVFVGFGIGAVGIGVGAITGAMSLSKAGKAKDKCIDQKCNPSARPLIDSSLTLANVSNVAFGVGLAGVALGVIGLAISGGSPRPASAFVTGPTVRPLVGPGSLGLAGSL